jgi:hypothetical protein
MNIGRPGEMTAHAGILIRVWAPLIYRSAIHIKDSGQSGQSGQSGLA